MKLGVSCLLLALGGAAATAAAAPAPLEVPACITGRVLDLAGRPLVGVGMVLLSQREDGPAPTRMRSDARGAFVSSALVPGLYWLVAERLGFEPALVELQLQPGEARSDELRLTPLGVLAARVEGGREIPWLLRGLTGDPLRVVEGEPATLPDGSVRPSLLRPVQGRVAWNAIAGDPSDEEGGLLAGKRTELNLDGTIAGSTHWHLASRRDELELPMSKGGDAVGSERLSYQLERDEGAGGIGFRGELLRATRQLGAEAGALELEERRASYEVDYRTAGRNDQLGLTLAYRAAVAQDGRGGEAGAELPSDHHAIWEGRGRYAKRLGPRHLLMTLLHVRAQQWSAPNQHLLADVTPQAGLLRDARHLEPRAWQLFVSEEHQWTLWGPFALVSGADFAHSSGASGAPYLRPRLGAMLNVDDHTRLRVDSSWLLYGLEAAGTTSGANQQSGSRATRLSLERDLGHDGLVRFSALRNGYRDVEETQPAPESRSDFLLFALGAVESRELRGHIRLPSRGGITGFATGSVGTAHGDLSLLPLRSGRPGGGLYLLPDGAIRYGDATLGASLLWTGTDIVIRYHWLDVVNDGGESYARIDLELGQEVPWWELGGSRLDFLVALRGYLGRPEQRDGSETFLVFDPSPTLAAGVAVRF